MFFQAQDSALVSFLHLDLKRSSLKPVYMIQFISFIGKPTVLKHIRLKHAHGTFKNICEAGVSCLFFACRILAANRSISGSISHATTEICRRRSAGTNLTPNGVYKKGGSLSLVGSGQPRRIACVPPVRELWKHGRISR